MPRLFAPDATFAINLRNDHKAYQYLTTVGLERGAFICVIPRLRFTPYWKVHGTEPTEAEKKTFAVSEKFREKDHAKLRVVITEWVQKTGLKVLACPEMTYEVELAKSELVDPLPDEIKKNVVWRNSYWNPDEAASIYAQSKVVLSIEMHSPIIAAAMGVPAIHVRQPTDTRKGQMWRDIGLADWLFEIDKCTGNEIAETLLGIQANYPMAKIKLAEAMTFVEKCQNNSMRVVKKSLFV
jgi:polysaccharide pyruvyl transferase WcaK-like protein